MIACLGWGSLVWDYRQLPVDGRWLENGPQVQVEFLRQSKDGRMTLVLDRFSIPVTALWAPMNVSSLDEARSALAQREGISSNYLDQSIASWSSGEMSPPCIQNLDEWADNAEVEQVVWTGLKPRFSHKSVRPEKDEVISYLGALEGSVRAAAEQYVRKAPRQIDTEFRRAIEQTLGWRHVD